MPHCGTDAEGSQSSKADGWRLEHETVLSEWRQLPRRLVAVEGEPLEFPRRVSEVECDDRQGLRPTAEGIRPESGSIPGSRRISELPESRTAVLGATQQAAVSEGALPGRHAPYGLLQPDRCKGLATL
jgi:hypothetical protein